MKVEVNNLIRLLGVYSMTEWPGHDFTLQTKAMDAFVDELVYELMHVGPPKEAIE